LLGEPFLRRKLDAQIARLRSPGKAGAEPAARNFETRALGWCVGFESRAADLAAAARSASAACRPDRAFTDSIAADWRKKNFAQKRSAPKARLAETVRTLSIRRPR
jgi:hypothetical protein